MNVFGQVWLWSLLSFVAGVLLTWLVMVRPARKQVADLEDQLLEARSRPAVAPPADDLERDFDAVQWDDTPPRSLSDEVPAPAPYVEPPAYRGEPVSAPVPEVEEEPEPVAAAPLMSPEEAQRRFEEQLAEQKALTDVPAEDERPRSLFERLSPETAPEETPAEMTTVLPRSGLEAADFDDEPELPAEQTSYERSYEPTAEVAAPAPEPTAPAEVHEPVDDFIYQPREVWAEQEQEAFLDEAAEQEDEPPAGPTASEQTTFIAVEESAWPANDLTGEYPGLRDEITGRLDGFTEPETPAEQTLVQPMDLDAPHVRNGVFEPAQETFTGPAHARRDVEAPEQVEEPGYAEPAAYEPEPARDEPTYTEPTYVEPAREHHAPAQPAPYAEPVREQPTYAEPAAYVEPVREHHAPAQPTPYAEPVREQPTYAEPAPYAQPFAAPGTPVTAFHAFGEATPPQEQERQPRAVAAAFDHPVEAPPAPTAPEPVADRPRSLFEPLLDADEPLPPTGQTRQLPDAVNDQPFVPKFVPSDEPLLAAPPEPEPEPVQTDLPQRLTEAGLPIREARRTTMQRQQSFPAFQAFEAPKQEAPPAPALPSRPRPVGFSPSTGGRPNGTPAPGSPRYQQPEGFNPRSPFGPGSVLPKSDGLAPAADFAVKATLTGRRYYTESSANFQETRADVWFRTETDAQKAGFRPAP